MATCEQLSDSLFCVRWVNPRYTTHGTVEVKIEEIDQICKMNYNVVSGTTVFNVEVVPNQEKVDATVLQPFSVSANKFFDQQQLHFLNSKWTVTFQSSYICCGKLGLIFEVLIRFPGGKGSKRIVNQLLHLWETKALADITFNLEHDGKTEKVEAHSQILASGSPVLAAMFQEKFKEGTERIAVIKDVEPALFEKLLRFIYTGLVDLDSDTVSNLFQVAEKYVVEELKEECAQYMMANLSVENAIRFLVLSHLCNSASLHQSTLKFMSENAKAICSRKEWLDVIKKYPELSFVAMQNMAM